MMTNMSTSQRSSQYVEVQLEIGHKATPKVKTAEDGHTHDWTVFVRGPENSNIQHFVEKVVFHLHQSFPKPKRVMKEPPYQVSESGYASFELPVEVYFKNKEEPKKISFDYDLYLRLDDAVSHSRREKLTFQNPSNDFKKKLLKAGGVTNETNASTAKTANISEEKQSTQQTPTSGANSTKYSKTSVSGTDSKRTKNLGLIPSKDKSLINSQNSTTTSSSNPSFTSDKPTVPSITPSNNNNNNKFTELFGTPIQARPPTDSKSKESLAKNKLTAIASKGVKNDSKSLHKNSAKNTFSSPFHKGLENKSSKETKESKDLKDSKVGPKAKESTKSKREEEIPLNKSKKKSIESPKRYDKKSNSKPSKKRRNSSSSNSSSITTSSFVGSTESKVRKDSQKLSSIKEKDNKKENKKQKVSSKDMNTASGVKKQSSTSTKISFSDNNSSTTIEIKSVKKEKTWDNEVKKSKSKEFKSSEFKASKDKDKDKANANTCASISGNKTKSQELNASKSPRINGNKHLKAPKDKYNSDTRERSSSPSSVSLTPDGRALSSPFIAGPNNTMRADIESHESMSPLSSDNTSTAFRFEPIRPNCDRSDTNERLDSDGDSDSDEHSSKQSSKQNKNLNSKSYSKDSEQNNRNKTENLKSVSNKRKRDVSLEPNKRLDHTLTPGPTIEDSVLEVNELIEMQKKINESTNSDLLQKIVDVIEESGLFCLTESSFDFDLMKLDLKTVRKLRAYMS